MLGIHCRPATHFAWCEMFRLLASLHGAFARSCSASRSHTFKGITWNYLVPVVLGGSSLEIDFSTSSFQAVLGFSWLVHLAAVNAHMQARTHTHTHMWRMRCQPCRHRWPAVCSSVSPSSLASYLGDHDVLQHGGIHSKILSHQPRRTIIFSLVLGDRKMQTIACGWLQDLQETLTSTTTLLCFRHESIRLVKLTEIHLKF